MPVDPKTIWSLDLLIDELIKGSPYCYFRLPPGLYCIELQPVINNSTKNDLDWLWSSNLKVQSRWCNSLEVYRITEKRKYFSKFQREFYLCFEDMLFHLESSLDSD